MVRTACVDLPALPLQLLLRKHPDWSKHPIAVVDVDRPNGRVLWSDERARAKRVLPGMRYAAALSLAPELRAAEVPPEEIERAVAGLAVRMRRYTPNVEPVRGDADLGGPGTFWLDASGLERLHTSLREWADLVLADLTRIGLRATVVVGFTRFGSHALARAKRGALVVGSAGEERAAARRVPLDLLSLDPRTCEGLRKLGVTTVGGFADLPADGVGTRFGEPARRMHRLATGDLQVPLQPERPLPPAVEKRLLDHAETDVERLLYGVAGMLEALVATVGSRGRAIAELKLGLRFERMNDHVETVRPAAPTLDATRLLELVRLRMQAVRRLPDGVEELTLYAGEVEAEARQRHLLVRRARDLDAANRALARVRARLGETAVARARLREGHLPEARFRWEPLDRIAEPRPGAAPGAGHLVRRIQLRPVPLPPRPRHEPDGWMLRGLEQGPVDRVTGPYVVSGGWWNRAAVHREYHFAETHDGEVLWVFWDRARRRWFLHGRVE